MTTSCKDIINATLILKWNMEVCCGQHINSLLALLCFDHDVCVILVLKLLLGMFFVEFGGFCGICLLCSLKVQVKEAPEGVLVIEWDLRWMNILKIHVQPWEMQQRIIRVGGANFISVIHEDK